MKNKIKEFTKNINKSELIMSIIIGLICIILVCTISIQFKTVEETNITDIENMREAELRTQISSWKTRYEETSKKLEENNNTINEYREKLNNDQETEELLDKELAETDLLVGKTDVKGEGVIVTLTDSEESTITSSDLLELVNELRYAGAEAISINDIRITNSSYIATVNATLIRIDLQRVTSPYVVKAIGNQTYLESGLTTKDYGYIDRVIKAYDKTATVERQDNVKILKYAGEMKLQYAE